MNKYNVFFAFLIIFLTTSSMLSLNSQDEQARIDRICILYEGNMLNSFQYIANGSFDQALVERDIALLKKDTDQLLKEKSWATGLYASKIKPAFLKGMGALFCIDAVVTGAVTCVFAYLFHDIWTSSIAFNLADKMAPAAINLRDATVLDRTNSWKTYYQYKYDYLMASVNDNEKMILTSAPPIVFCSLINIIGSSIIARRFFASLAKHKSKNKALIQQLHDRYSRNLCIIAYLQQMEHEITHR